MSKISVDTVLNIFNDLIALIDLLNKTLFKGSPSSIRNWFLTTSSIVTLFPRILICFT